MNGFDKSILTWVNHYARQSELFDVCVRSLDLDLLKGGLFVAALFCAWNSRRPEQLRRRQIIVATVIAALCAIAIGRGLAAWLPFRPRPVFRPELNFVPPFGEASDMLRTWSAFPSDHAMFFGALATGIAYLSARAGALAHLYVAVVILAPRIYLGKHHPTDILAGYALGVLIAVAANRARFRTRAATAALRCSERWPAAFHAIAFLLMLQFATTFDTVKALVHAGLEAGRVATARVRPEVQMPPALRVPVSLPRGAAAAYSQ